MKPLIIDIETNNLLSDMLDYSELPYKLNSQSKLWVVVVTNALTKEVFKATKEEITKEWLQEVTKDCTHLIAHNGIKFDFPVLKLFGVLDYKVGYLGQKDELFGKPCQLVDTLIWSRLFNPQRYKGHSLDVWGERTGNKKTDFRQLCIDKGYIDKSSPKGEEFRNFVPEMVDYCVQDTLANIDVYEVLQKERSEWGFWEQALQQEHILANYAICRETFGFDFDKDLAIECLKDLEEKMNQIQAEVDPILPLKPMNIGELKMYTPPKIQIKKDGSLANSIYKFAEKIGAEIVDKQLIFEDVAYDLPHHEPLKEFTEATIADLDHVKQYLISLGWIPTEWRVRDLTKDSKKQYISFEKRKAALKRWLDDTFDKEKYKELRLVELDAGSTKEEIWDNLIDKLREDYPVNIPTSPSLRVGIEKNLCPNLEKLGEDVEVAKQFSLYLTYRHRKSAIAGGDIEDMDFDDEVPNTGYLAMYREQDGRIPTPAIEIGANTSRYRHIGVCNVPRASSVYGEQMRSLFGAGKDYFQFGFDFSSLEYCVMGHYVYKYKGGKDLSVEFVAQKPNDFHTLQAARLGISRGDCKSVNYGVIYGSMPAKVKKMLGVSLKRAKEIWQGFWDSAPALKELKEKLTSWWENHGAKYIRAIDGRLIYTRSKHSILNALFQSGGVIFAKYVTIFMYEELEKQGLKWNCFESKPDFTSMIEYHDECQLAIRKDLVKFEIFDTEEQALEFVEKWSGEGQLSTIAHARKYYVVYPNVVSQAITNAITRTEELLKMNVKYGFEWVVGRNWYECH